ncbi:unnamed protein product [Aphanomyces euteiches]|uniref:Selenoprotein T n=1 Tax=Aphanomyces euteiches TaxID=100861 RepID=A0A6G0XNH9_9STRA|nr:hypothetical protein Ae201684_002904 [Aphanomyces euteiches]KAH9093150.1 hypothetical protein Ae201684P_008810 [Aphanomyces euteiches]KAH9122707.1 hypothetical protein LEN26_010149 [Aphanomyces euteiches]KAH9125205.1 hypothetical protein AeMF1_004141 [Aphanomyces euteiches]KAH9192382.1 hypothetical protein AeNC1_005638 [Aphanomyces euteiches]
MAPKSKNDKKSDDRIVIQYDKTCFAPHLKQFQEGFKNDFPHMTVDVEKYPLTTPKQTLVTFIFVIQLAMTTVFMFGINLLEYFKIDLDAATLKWFEENKFMIVPGMLMLSPVRQLISKTNAFEVYLNGELVSSTLNTRIIPNFPLFKETLEKKKGIKPVKH